MLTEVETHIPLAVSRGHEPDAVSGLAVRSPPSNPPSNHDKLAQVLPSAQRSPRRVAIVSVFREGYGGGSGFATYGLARRLAQRCDTALVCPGDSTGMVEDGTPLKRITVASAGEGEVVYPLLDRVNADRLFGLLDQFAPDLVHAHDTVQLSMVAQHWAARRSVPFVLTFHLLPGRELEFGFGDRLRVLNGCLLRPLVSDYLKRFYRHCDGGIMMHDAVDRLLARGSRPARVFKVSSALDLQRFVRCRPASTRDAVYNLCFVGFLSERKNQLYLLEVMQHLPKSYRLLLVGEALLPEYEDRLRSYTRAAGLDNVEFTGRLPHDSIPGCLERSHVFVSASRLEVQSTVINEALASGTPVVALDNETLDLVDDSVGYHLPKDARPAEFARCVKSICDLPQADYEALCRRARDRAKGMDWPSVVDEHVAAYEAILSDRARKPERPDAADRPSGESNLTMTRLYARATMDVSTAMYYLNRHRLARHVRAEKTPAAY